MRLALLKPPLGGGQNQSEFRLYNIVASYVFRLEDENYLFWPWGNGAIVSLIVCLRLFLDPLITRLPLSPPSGEATQRAVQVQRGVVSLAQRPPAALLLEEAPTHGPDRPRHGRAPALQPHRADGTDSMIVYFAKWKPCSEISTNTNCNLLVFPLSGVKIIFSDVYVCFSLFPCCCLSKML